MAAAAPKTKADIEKEFASAAANSGKQVPMFVATSSTPKYSFPSQSQLRVWEDASKASISPNLKISGVFSHVITNPYYNDESETGTTPVDHPMHNIGLIGPNEIELYVVWICIFIVALFIGIYNFQRL